MNSMLHKAICSLVLLICGLASTNVSAAEYRVGVDVEVSFKESEADIERHYSSFLDELGKATGNKFVFSGVFSNRVDKAIEAKQHDWKSRTA